MAYSQEEFAAWLATRPKECRELAKKFPYRKHVANSRDKAPLFVIGWAEGDRVLVSPILPESDRQASLSAGVYLSGADLYRGTYRERPKDTA